MAKYRINYKTSPHGAISWKHEGNDDQYCEAGELVTIDWQPSAGWGLQEAHYTDALGNATDIDITTKTFTMPSKDITIEGTFKKFELDDWTGDEDQGKAVDAITVTDITALTEKQIKGLRSGDVVVLRTGNTRKSYRVSVKGTGDLQLTYSDYNGVDTVKYVSGVYSTTEHLDTTTPLSVEIEYDDLVDLRDNGNLVPGTWYRITDYTCTTTQENTQSAGHLFDIVVLALDGSHLAEEAFAAHHAGDTYFSNCKLDAWELKYCLDNDTDRFGWADDTNGKGVVYRMIDEFNNDMPYDFKNIQFIRHKKDLDHIVNAASFIADDGGSAIEVQIANNITASATANKAVRSFLYGFEDIREASEFSDLLDFNSVAYEDDDLYCVLQETDDYFSAVAKVLDNTLACYTFMADNGTDASLSASNNIHDTEMLPLIEGNAAKLNNGVCFGSGCSGWSCGNGCHSWSCGNGCHSWSCGNNCYGWSCGNNCYGWSCGNNCYGWSCGNYCHSWSCGNYCHSWSCGSGCSGWSCGNSCYGWSCGNGCHSWSCGNNCYGWSCGNGCHSWSCGNNCNGWSCGNGSYGWSCGSDCYGWSCGSDCNGWSCGNGSYGWSCGNNCKNFNILDGFSGSSFDSLDAEGLVTNAAYCQFVAIDSNFNIKIWNPAD